MRYQEELEYQANYDTLTRLPNRNLLKDRLQHAIETARRRDAKIAVVFMDLDGFKNVNDSLGHSVGDRLLAVIAERLARSARTSDTVARHGGDEFVVVLPDITDEAGLIVWMERTRAAISEPVWIDDTELYVGCSMGASLYPQDGDDAETVMKKADLAMYRAKDMGRNNYQFYQPEMNASVGARMNLERRLRRAARRRIPAALSAAGRHVDASDRRHRSARALARPRARARVAGVVHSGGGGERADRTAFRMGAARSVPAEQGVAGCGCRRRACR